MKFGKFEILLVATGIFLFGLGAVKNPQMSLMFFDILLGEHHELIGGFFILVSIFLFYLGMRKKPLGKSSPPVKKETPQPGQPQQQDNNSNGGGKKKRKKKKDRKN